MSMTAQIVQKRIPFLDYILPPIISKQEAADLLGRSPRTVLRRYLNRAFFEEIGEDYETVKPKHDLSPAATIHFFNKYPAAQRKYRMDFLKENKNDRLLCQLVFDRPLIPQ